MLNLESLFVEITAVREQWRRRRPGSAASACRVAAVDRQRPWIDVLSQYRQASRRVRALPLWERDRLQAEAIEAAKARVARWRAGRRA
jgi:hypothetical protein